MRILVDTNILFSALLQLNILKKKDRFKSRL